MRTHSQGFLVAALAALLLSLAAALPTTAQDAPPPAAQAPGDAPVPDEPPDPGDEPLIDDRDPEPSPSGATTSTPTSPMPTAAIAGMMSAFFIVYFVFIALMIALGLGSVVLSCLAIYDCARRDFPDPNTRAMWCLLIALTRLLGAIIYYFVVYRSGDPPLQRAHVPGAPPPSPMSG